MSLHEEHRESLKAHSQAREQALLAQIDRPRALLAKRRIFIAQAQVRALSGDLEELLRRERIRERPQEQVAAAGVEEKPQLQRLSKKLAMLKAEVNRSQRQMRDKLEEEEQRGEAAWSQVSGKLKEHMQRLVI